MDKIQYIPNNPDANIRQIIDIINQMIDDRNTGQGWEIQVKIDRTEEGIYNSLPTEVQAAMIEEEMNAALAEMEEI